MVSGYTMNQSPFNSLCYCVQFQISQNNEQPRKFVAARLAILHHREHAHTTHEEEQEESG
jgi:hypothetical protein